MRLDGKVAIVTGAARGLGRAYALKLAELGADVVVIDIDLRAAAEYGESLSAASVSDEVIALGRRSLGLQVDLVDRMRVFDAVDAVMQHFGRVDILVNNAGGAITPAQRSAASITPESDTRRLMDVNYMSAVNGCQAIAPIMVKQQAGVIVNTSAQTGIATYKGGLLAGYGASKAALAAYSRCLAAELGPSGIRVNCISPGVMMTARVAQSAAQRGVGTADEMQTIPLRRFGVVDDCANALAFLVSDLSSYITGQVLSVCGGAVLTPH